MKRISYWVLSTVSVFVLLFAFDASQRGGSAGVGTPAAISGGTAGTTSGGSSSNSPGSSNSSGSTPQSNGNSNSNKGSSTHTPSTSSATRTVTGTVAMTQWGPVQVQLKVGNGSISKVTVLQYPNGNSRDVEIANYSLPILIQETMQSQNANIDMVSGATFTSEGYLQSLQSALDQADL